MHPTKGQLRAYQDGELDAVHRRDLEAHLQTCKHCQRTEAELRSQAESSARRLNALNPRRQPVFSSPAAARRKLEMRLANRQKENHSMFTRLFSRGSRPAWIGLTLVVLLALSLAFPPVRAFANRLLGLFRVQQIRVVQINPGDLPALGESGRFESLITRNVAFEPLGESQPVDSAEAASALVGFPVRLPVGGSLPQPALSIQSGGIMTFKVDLPLVQGVLDEVGRQDITLPESIDGADVALTIPQGVMANYGKCEFDPQKERAEGYDPDDPNRPHMPLCTTLYQLSSPTLEAPEGLDLTSLGEAYLQILGMSQPEAEQFASQVDWTSTFILPIPQANTRYRETPVDGVTGILIEHRMAPGKYEFVLTWVKDGILYALMGPGDYNTALEAATDLR